MRDRAPDGRSAGSIKRMLRNAQEAVDSARGAVSYNEARLADSKALLEHELQWRDRLDQWLQTRLIEEEAAHTHVPYLDN